MKTFQSMAIGGCIVAVLVIGLQAVPDVQWLVVLAAGVFGLVALVSLAVEAVLPHLAPQPVVKPVVQPIDMVLQPPQPVAESWSQPAQPAQPVADRWSQPLAQPVVLDMQPPATGSQPARRPADIMASMIVDEVPPMRPVPWLEQKIAPIAVDDDPAELPVSPTPALPLPRRAPTAAEYPLVWEAIEANGSMNAAILAVYGSKDGKTHRWVARVAEFYRQGEPITGGNQAQDIFYHELLGTVDLPGMVAARLGLEVDDQELAGLMYGVQTCDECSCWYIDACRCQQSEEVD